MSSEIYVRVWVVARFPDVVNIEIVQCNTAIGWGSAEWTFNVAVAGIVGILTG